MARLENINLNIIQPFNILLRLYPSLPGVEGARTLTRVSPRAAYTEKQLVRILYEHMGYGMTLHPASTSTSEPRMGDPRLETAVALAQPAQLARWWM